MPSISQHPWENTGPVENRPQTPDKTKKSNETGASETGLSGGLRGRWPGRVGAGKGGTGGPYHPDGPTAAPRQQCACGHSGQAQAPKVPASAQQNGGCTHRDNVHCPLHPAPGHGGTLYSTRLEDKLLRRIYFSFHPRSRGSFSQGPNSRLCRCKNRNCQDSSTPRLQNVEKPQSRKCRSEGMGAMQAAVLRQAAR